MAIAHTVEDHEYISPMNHDPALMSIKERLALLPDAARREWLLQQEPQTLAEMAQGRWWYEARPKQVPPDGNWLVCLALAGRGFGKSRAGSEWIVKRVIDHPTDRHGNPTEHLVIAATLSDARTICMEGPSGILRALSRWGMKPGDDYTYKMSPRPMILFKNGCKIYCESGDDEDVGRGYTATSAWLDEICVAENEPVVTRRGIVRVQDVLVGDEVLTRSGWHRVLVSRRSKQAQEILRIETGQGSVRVTGNHPIWTHEEGWVRADRIQLGHTIVSCTNTKPPSPPRQQPSWTGMVSAGTTTNAPVTTTTGMGTFCTAPSGPRSTDRSRTATRSITSTGSAGTPGSRTSSASPPRFTAPSPRTTRLLIPRGEPTTPPKLLLPGSLLTGSDANLLTSSVSCAAKHSHPLECVLSTVQRPAATKSSGYMKLTAVTSVVREPLPADVFDLTVEGEPEFFAGSGSLLVHNCKWPKAYGSWYEGIMPALRADLSTDHPRAFVTTTPKPDKLIIEWYHRDDGTVHLIRGSTFENRSNLNQHVVEELRQRYEGTSLGKQELYGDLLEGLDGALFRLTDIEADRLVKAPDDLVTIVVGVDPTLTDEGDEMGVIVMGRDKQDHMYCLADESVAEAGRNAARHVWQVLAAWGADLVVCENNLGKNWMTDVFRDAYNELRDEGLFPADTTPPFKTVDAKLGKRTRGEPVAMRSQQHRMHHVGTFKELEEQLTQFTGWDGKESPDRLDAYVHSARWLMSTEKKKVRIFSPRTYIAQDLNDLAYAGA